MSTQGLLTEGDSVTLTCSSEGAPAVESFAWFREGESGSVPDSFKPELKLWSLDYRDYGEYSCVARNAIGTDRSRPVLVNVTCKSVLVHFTGSARSFWISSSPSVVIRIDLKGFFFSWKGNRVLWSLTWNLFSKMVMTSFVKFRRFSKLSWISWQFCLGP